MPEKELNQWSWCFLNAEWLEQDDEVGCSNWSYGSYLVCCWDCGGAKLFLSSENFELLKTFCLFFHLHKVETPIGSPIGDT